MNEIMQGQFGSLIKIYQDGDKITLKTRLSNQTFVPIMLKAVLIAGAVGIGLYLAQLLGSETITDENTERLLSLLLIAVIAVPFIILKVLKGRDWQVIYVFDLAAKALSFSHPRINLFQSGAGAVSIDENTVAVQNEYRLSIQHGHRSAQTALLLDTAPREATMFASGDDDASEVRTHVSALNFFLDMARENKVSQPEAPEKMPPKHNPMD